MALKDKRKNRNTVIKKPNAKNIRNMLKKSPNKYIRRGIAINHINADNKFDVLDGEMGKIIMNIIADG